MMSWLFKETPGHVHQENIWAELDQQFRQGILTQLHSFVSDELKSNQEQPLYFYLRDVEHTQKNKKTFIRKTADIIGWSFPWINPFVFELNIISNILDRVRRFRNHRISPPDLLDFDNLDVGKLNKISPVEVLNNLYNICPNEGGDSYTALSRKVQIFLKVLVPPDSTKDSTGTQLASNFNDLQANRDKVKEAFAGTFGATADSAPEARFFSSIRCFFGASDTVYEALTARHQDVVKDSQRKLGTYTERLKAIWKELDMAAPKDGVYVVAELRPKLREKFPGVVLDSTTALAVEAKAKQEFNGSDLTDNTGRIAALNSRAETFANIIQQINILYDISLSKKYTRLERLGNFCLRKKQDIYANEVFGNDARRVVSRIKNSESSTYTLAKIMQLTESWAVYLETLEGTNSKKKNAIGEIGRLAKLLENSALTVLDGQLKAMDEGCIDGDQKKVQVYEQYKQVASIVYAELGGAGKVTDINPVDLIKQAKQSNPAPSELRKRIQDVEADEKSLAVYVNNKRQHIVSRSGDRADLNNTFNKNRAEHLSQPIAVIFILSLLQWFHALKSDEYCGASPQKKSKSKDNGGEGCGTNDSACFAAIYLAQWSLLNVLAGGAESVTVDFSEWTRFDYYNNPARKDGSAFKKLHTEILASLPSNGSKPGVLTIKQMVVKHRTGSDPGSNGMAYHGGLNPQGFIAGGSVAGAAKAVSSQNPSQLLSGAARQEAQTTRHTIGGDERLGQERSRSWFS